MGKGKEFAVKTAAFLGITAATVSNGTNGWEEASEITGQPLDNTVSTSISVLHVPSQPDADISDAIEETLNGIENKEKAEAASDKSETSASSPDPPDNKDNNKETDNMNENNMDDFGSTPANENEEITNTAEDGNTMDDFGSTPANENEEDSAEDTTEDMESCDEYECDED